MTIDYQRNPATGLSAKDMVFVDVNGLLAREASAFVWDYTNKRLGILTAAPTNDLSFGGQAARIIWLERELTAATAGNSLTVQSGGAFLAGTDLAGGDLLLSGGVATGAGVSGVRLKVYGSAATGTADGTQIDGVYVVGGSGASALPLVYIGGNSSQPGTTFKGARIWGCRDGSAQVTGQVGEVLETTQSTPQTAASTGTYKELNNIVLTAGVWLISTLTQMTNATTTFTGSCETNIATATASTTGTTVGYDRAYITQDTISTTAISSATISNKLVNISSTTTYYHNVMATFSANAPSFAGSIRALRIR